MIGEHVWHDGHERRNISERVRPLLEAAAVRTRCADILEQARHGELRHFQWHPENIRTVTDYIVGLIEKRFPDRCVPPHSRWRHFEALNYRPLDTQDDKDPGDCEEITRQALDLVIPSVLLDAGAGPNWCYKDPVRGALRRSEGLAAASLALFLAGGFSSDSASPLQTDIAGLSAFSSETLRRAFQVGPDNPLLGIAERAALMRRLGSVMACWPEIFGLRGRLGNLFDYIKHYTVEGEITASDLLNLLLRVFATLWPERLILDGVPLGDCWHHPASRDGYIPFHKLSQWMTYSLIEPLAIGGITVRGCEQLTGLAEYRNGGLLLDTGILKPLDPDFLTTPQAVSSEAVVEWRAMTVSTLDILRVLVSERLGYNQRKGLSLAQIMEGGTWVAGREWATMRRPTGTPPVAIESDGTVF